ncbi:MAG TPA: universal stress protein [Ktedonobacterales bacterium]|nr:universal stress protein [Ktedonobacterales bacterium]
MFSRILVPLDGSSRAEQALPIAGRIARWSGASVVLVRGITVPAMFGVMYEGQALKWRSYLDEQGEAQAYLGAVAQSAYLAHAQVETHVAFGAAADVIVNTAVKREADLVVMMSHGRTGLGRWMLGSVADHIAHHSPIPVLIMREGAGSSMLERADERQPLHVLVPLDGSPLAETALGCASALALALAKPGSAHVHLMLVVAPYRAMRTYMPDALLLDGAAAYLEKVAQRLPSEVGDEALTVTWSIVAQGDIAHGIIAAAEMKEAGETSVAGESHSRCDLIAMATHGQSAVARWALGSVTERVLHGTMLPLLIVRPCEIAAAAMDGRDTTLLPTDDPGS